MLAFVLYPVLLGVMGELSSVVPLADALILNTKEAVADELSPAYRTPTWTTLMVSPEPIAPGLAAKL